jgi:hypothetical protein
MSVLISEILRRRGCQETGKMNSVPDIVPDIVIFLRCRSTHHMSTKGLSLRHRRHIGLRYRCRYRSMKLRHRCFLLRCRSVLLLCRIPMSQFFCSTMSCGLVGKATTFIGGDVGLIPTCCALEVWQWTFWSRTVWLVNKSAGQHPFYVGDCEAGGGGAAGAWQPQPAPSRCAGAMIWARYHEIVISEG